MYSLGEIGLIYAMIGMYAAGVFSGISSEAEKIEPFPLATYIVSILFGILWPLWFIVALAMKVREYVRS